MNREGEASFIVSRAIDTFPDFDLCKFILDSQPRI